MHQSSGNAFPIRLKMYFPKCTIASLILSSLKFFDTIESLHLSINVVMHFYV